MSKTVKISCDKKKLVVRLQNKICSFSSSFVFSTIISLNLCRDGFRFYKLSLWDSFSLTFIKGTQHERHLTLSLHLYEESQRQSHGLGVQAAERLGGCGSGDGFSVLLGVVSQFCWILGSWQPTYAHHLKQGRWLFASVHFITFISFIRKQPVQ